jgi:hypothetical protein
MVEHISLAGPFSPFSLAQNLIKFTESQARKGR